MAEPSSVIENEEVFGAVVFKSLVSVKVMVIEFPEKLDIGLLVVEKVVLVEI